MIILSLVYQLLFIKILFWYKLHMWSCRVPASMRCVVQVLSVENIYPYIALQPIIVYTEVQWDAHLESQEQG